MILLPYHITVSPESFLFSVSLISITAQLHRFRVHFRLQREKPFLHREEIQREGANNKREPHMVHGFSDSEGYASGEFSFSLDCPEATTLLTYDKV